MGRERRIWRREGEGERRRRTKKKQKEREKETEREEDRERRRRKKKKKQHVHSPCHVHTLHDFLVLFHSLLHALEFIAFILHAFPLLVVGT